MKHRTPGQQYVNLKIYSPGLLASPVTMVTHGLRAHNIHLLDTTSWRCYLHVSSAVSVGLSTVGHSYLNKLLEYSVGAQIAL